MTQIADYRISKNLWNRYTRFLAAPGGGFFYGFLSLLLLSTLFSAAGFAQQVQPTISAEVEEYISISGTCDPSRPEVRRIYQEYHLLWSRTPLPYDDPSSPQGYWTYLVFMSPLNGSARVIGFAENSGRAHILTSYECSTNPQAVVARYRALIQGQQWHVFSDFVYPGGIKKRLSSNFAQVPVPNEEIFAKSALIALENMSFTRIPSISPPGRCSFLPRTSR